MGKAPTVTNRLWYSSPLGVVGVALAHVSVEAHETSGRAGSTYRILEQLLKKWRA